MTQRRFEAIAFDLWDTLVIDDSDEIKRERQGLLSKPEQRRELLWQALDRERSTARAAVCQAYDDGDAAFRAAWHDEHVTWDVRTRLRLVLQKLDRELPEPAFHELVRAHEEMELEVRPDLVPGCAETLRGLAADYRLAIVSDAIVSPGRCLRELLRLHDIEQYFSAFAFSDEVGRSKPHPAMFKHVAAALGVEPAQMVHIARPTARAELGAASATRPEPAWQPGHRRAPRRQPRSRTCPPCRSAPWRRRTRVRARSARASPAIAHTLSASPRPPHPTRTCPRRRRPARRCAPSTSTIAR